MLFPVFVGIDMLLCYYENHWGKILNFGAYFIKFNKIPISGFPSSDCDNMLFQPAVSYAIYILIQDSEYKLHRKFHLVRRQVVMSRKYD